MITTPASKFRIAAIQATPVFLDRSAPIDKACGLIATAGHYARPDVFQLTVNREPRTMIREHNDSSDFEKIF